MPRSRVLCFVTSSHVAHNPRLVKEAVAAEGAGYRVRIIAVQTLPWVSEFDSRLMAQHPRWEFIPLAIHGHPFCARWLRLKSALCSRWNRAAFFLFQGKFGNAERANNRVYPEMLRLACGQRDADLYIGHNLEALPVVAHASRINAKPFGFDLEDAYFAQEGLAVPRANSLIEMLEKRYLAQAAYITASSPLIAEAYAERYRINLPVTVLNVFPWKEREGLTHSVGLKDRKDFRRISLYWFSQTIGLNRGIQDVLLALRQLPDPNVEIHLRGFCQKKIQDELRKILGPSSLRDHFYIHPQVDPGEMLERAAEHDIGLALETNREFNRNSCIPNKIFFYMLAGLAIVASETNGQKSIMLKAGDAGICYPCGDVKRLAEGIIRLIKCPNLLAGCKKASLDHARVRFNWELESEIFLEQVRQALETKHISS